MWYGGGGGGGGGGGMGGGGGVQNWCILFLLYLGSLSHKYNYFNSIINDDDFKDLQ